jgi:hypothetical protein
MSRRYSPNHPAVKSSPHVMTPRQWSRLYRVPLLMVGGGFVVAMLGWLMPAVALYGWPVSILWCLPGGAVCLAGFSRCQYIYEIERGFDK